MVILIVKEKQKEIISYVLKYRFLNGVQIQKLLNHKNHSRIGIWLNELANTGYLRSYKNTKNPTIPAVYSLGPKARQYLKDNPEFKNIPTALLDRIWREHKLSPQFRLHCQLVADIYLSLVSLTNKTGAKLNFYSKTDLYGMNYLILPNPDAYFSIDEANGSKSYFFLDIFDELPPRMVLRKRVRQYFEYFDNEYWQDHAKKPFPNIILVCPDDRSKNYLYRFIQGVLETEPELAFYLTTWTEVKEKGLVREALHKVDSNS